VAWAGTQCNFKVPRTEKGMPMTPAATLMVYGDLKQMSPKWLVGVSILGYGCSLAVGVGVPIPILNEEIASFTGVSDEEIFTQVVDYGYDYPNGIKRSYGSVSYAELKSGKIRILDKDVPTVPLSSYVRAREIAEILKGWIKDKRFVLSEPQAPFPGTGLYPMR